MESGPSQVVERAIAKLIPPACREEILGDMRERRASTGAFLAEAVCVVPFVIVSRVRRTSDPLLLLMEAMVAFTSFFTAAWWQDRAMLYTEWGPVRLMIPVAVMLFAIMLADAYSDPKKRWPLRPLMGPAFGTAFALGIGAALARPVAIWGGIMAVLLVSTMRLLFPPPADRNQAAKIPAFWMKLDPVPMKAGYVVLIVAVVALYAVSRIWG